MKTPIAIADICKGDVVREEYKAGTGNRSYQTATAIEYVATHDRHTIGRDNAVRWFLLDRPTPPVELPTEPTLGWLSWRIERANNSGVDLDFWSGPGDKRGAAMRGLSDADETSLYPADVTAFTPAVAVPAAALDELRRQHETAMTRTLNHAAETRRVAVNTFLRAVEANGGRA